MSLIVLALAVGGSLSIWALLAARRRRRLRDVTRLPPRRAVTTRGEPVERSGGELRRAGYSLDLGDVLGVGGDEVWVESAWLLAEGESEIAAVLHASDGSLLVMPSPRSALFRLEPTDVSLPADPPPVVDARGATFERASRLPVSIRAAGRAPDPPWNDGVFAEYRAVDGRALFVLGSTTSAKVWVASRVADDELENWGGGRSTLE